MDYGEKINGFISACNANGVRMIMVGGGAVNFHGYQRHSADVDFWIDISPDNMERLRKALMGIGYRLEKWPKKVLEAKQNISIKFSPQDPFELELITRFNPGKSFEQSFKDADELTITGNKILKCNILSKTDLINSKIKSGRSKDLLDVQVLKGLEDENGNEE